MHAAPTQLWPHIYCMERSDSAASCHSQHFKAQAFCALEI